MNNELSDISEAYKAKKSV